MLEKFFVEKIQTVISQLYNYQIDNALIQLQKTKENFEGDLTLVVFPFTKLLKQPPTMIAENIGKALLQSPLTSPFFRSFNVVQGFLNLSFTHAFYLDQLKKIYNTPHFGYKVNLDASKQPFMMVEYSSPNTNKPLHLGHVRNNLLGHSIAKIQMANGWKVFKTNIVNDRGIHICKSMLAWLKFANGETPESSGKKGDHLVGDYYVKFDAEYKKQIADLVQQGHSKEEAEEKAPIIVEARTMLKKWEDGDPQIRSLWQTMNEWVYQGFEQTYQRLGISFDKIYYESQTYLDGKKEVMRGLEEGIFYQKDDGSVWAKLQPYGLDDKILLRSDGTSVYITQDIGTAKARYKQYPIDKMVYVVGNEQEHHFKVLSIILDMLGFPFGKELVHYSYGMVELPNGKMKSREGSVVDADDLINQMVQNAKELNKGKVTVLADISDEEMDDISRKVGLGALKYFILKVDPKKNMLFNPEESIDFNGNTGPFIQYTYARIQSILRKFGSDAWKNAIPNLQISETSIPRLQDKEAKLIYRLLEYPTVVHEAGQQYSPALIANFAYALACDFNSFYHDFSVLNEPCEPIRHFRLLLCFEVATILQSAFDLLGIEMPDRM